MSINIKFKEKTYHLEKVKEGEEKPNAVYIQDLSLKELVNLYNAVAAELAVATKVLANFTPINRFVDRATGVSRLWKLLQTYNQYNLAPPEVEEVKSVQIKKPKKEVFKKLRIRRFTLKPTEKPRILKDANTLRGRCATLLLAGGNFEDVKSLVRQFNEERAKPASEEKVERRAYELVRIMHYYLNYGINHNIETGLIQLYAKQ